MSTLAQGPSTAVPVAPPTPQEINRKLSLHNKPAKTKSAPPAVSGTESDSDSFLSPDQSPHGAGTTYFGTTHHAHVLVPSSSATKPLSAIAERRSGSDGEETEDEDEDDVDGEEWQRDPSKSFDVNQRPQGQGRDGECTIKSGYLWKKGERRKTWKKRWFVLRPAHLAFYKTSAEYELLRLLDLNEVHSCAPVALKRHAHALALVSPARTYYLQAHTSQDMHDWVSRLNEARENLRSSSTQTSVTAPIPIPIPQGNRQEAHSPSAQMAISTSPPSGHIVTSDSESDDGQGGESAGYSPSAPTTMMASPSKANIDPSKVIVQGYLMKCSRSKRRGWRKRWFVLTGEKLTYSASHMETKRQRSIMLPQILDALEYDLEKPPGANGSGHHSLLSPPIGPSSVSPQSSHSMSSGAAARSLSGTSPGSDEHNRPIHAQDSSVGSGGMAGNPSIDHNAPQMASSSSQHGGQHTFKVVTTKRSLLLCAPSEDEEIKWLSAVRAVIARRTAPAGTPGASGGPNPTGPSSNPPNGTGEGSTASGGLGPRVSVSGMNRRRSASGASGIGPQ
ncbi:PH-domain-containing protein [Schizopora paradoxa]|uniref:PH-domain-containing protein n=1 Tax=Schizopora paradoxa TaxID=27342 RepID=A0A0H2RBI4_9AGAM|nr:PH-domain-containing protein [Schizopora paradoxa]